MRQEEASASFFIACFFTGAKALMAKRFAGMAGRVCRRQRSNPVTLPLREGIMAAKGERAQFYLISAPLESN
ncbi:hypothetical protein ACB268_11365 [Aeromonas sanarellii]|uniref:hypothetical protein n=1 Tax=Aeromonas sanarellii TaxID=633415 RepID=UPI002DB9AE79|nr:hypothetical protein [Aeromonas sanarellii]MEB6606826.1 hypothetical protein [Aeromonas sanarellii]